MKVIESFVEAFKEDHQGKDVRVKALWNQAGCAHQDIPT